MSLLTLTKEKLVIEDMEQGVGSVTQARGVGTKINADNLTYDGVSSIKAVVDTKDSIASVDAKLLLKADLNGDPLKVFEVATATTVDEAVPKGQMDNALALKADISYTDSGLALKADKTNVLGLNNTNIFNPTTNYQPATKKYVDDALFLASAADMTTAVYDTDNSGRVDTSEAVGSPSTFLGVTPANQIMRLGQTSITDCNTIADIGIYVGVNVLNAPVSGTIGLEQLVYGIGKTQRCTSIESLDIYLRSFDGVIWSPWVKNVDSLDIVNTLAGSAGPSAVLHAQQGKALDDKIALTAPLASPTFTGTVVLPSTTSIGGVSNTEIGYLDGVTSAIQTQLNAIALLASPAFTGVTAYHLLQGNLSVDNTVVTQGFNTTLYTGNGSTQSINTGIDMDTQWGDDASEKFGGLVWNKNRGVANNHYLFDTIRGVSNYIRTDGTNAQATLANSLTAFNSTGFTLGSEANNNTNTNTYASWNFQTTHRVSGTTNHGKAYTCHYNPFTGFTMVKYEGSGIAGHEIPHHLGRKLGLCHIKNLSIASDWYSPFDGGEVHLNTTVAKTGTGAVFSDSTLVVDSNSAVNGSGNSIIMYGWANSYFDEANTLIGNYEVGIYQGTGAAGNKVTTRGKPAWVMIKRLDSAGNWTILDNIRSATDPRNEVLLANLSSAEYVDNAISANFNVDGLSLQTTDVGVNAAGGQYLYMVVYDNDSGSGKSKYPRATDTSTLNLNAIVPFANGLDTGGTKNTILSKNETISGLTLTEGKNYVYAKNDGAYGVMSVAPTYAKNNPANGGDFYNVLENKWYTSAGAEITESRNYLNHIVYADNDGSPLYVEELPKVEYKDIIKVNKVMFTPVCVQAIYTGANITASDSIIPWTTKYIDTHNALTNGLFIVPEDGMYSITVVAGLRHTTSTGAIIVAVYGTVIQSYSDIVYDQQETTITVNKFASGERTFSLTKGAVISIKLRNVNGSSYLYGSLSSHLTIQKIGEI